jgi:hypothetical protein
MRYVAKGNDNEPIAKGKFCPLSFPVVSWRPGCVGSLYGAFARRTRGGAAVRVRQRGFEQEQQAQYQGRRDAHYGDDGDGELAP